MSKKKKWRRKGKGKAEEEELKGQLKFQTSSFRAF
jgi:hypothetical protein